MAENPRFNNSGMFTNSGDNYFDIAPDSTSEVLATQGNVINSIKVFWNKLRAKLAYAVTRPDYEKAVGGNYQPVYIDEHGVVQVCAPETITATIESGSNINIGNIPVHPGKTICVRLNGSFGGSATALKIGNVSVIYPSGASVYPANVNIDGTYLFTYMAGAGSTKWVLISSMNVADNNNPGLMTAAEHKKLDGIDEGANKYSLPAATSSGLGGVQLGYNENGQNYQVKKDGNNNLFVSVPWTDTNTHNTASLAMTVDKSASPNITLTDGSSSSSIQVIGSRGTQVAMGDEGQLIIDSQPGVIYNDLLDEDLGEQTPVTVPYPSQGRRKATRFLNGLGEWVTSTDKLYAGQNLTITNTDALATNANTLTGKLTIYNAASERVPCAFLIVKSDNTTDVVSSANGVLNFDNYSVNLPLYGVKYIPYFPINDETNYQTQYMPGVVKISRPNSSSIKYNIL